MLKVYNTTALYVNQCILPDIIVYSKGGFKRMDEITTNDYLITKDGSFKKVNEIIINQKNEEILHIKTQHGIDPLKCTKIHDWNLLNLHTNVNSEASAPKRLNSHKINSC